MKGIATCQDCRFNITIYRFTGSQGFFRVPKVWCEECDLTIAKETLIKALKNVVQTTELS